jgi:hypothetical protein
MFLLHSTTDEKSALPNKAFFFIDSPNNEYSVLKH